MVYVLDSFALLAYFRNESGTDIIEQLLIEATSDQTVLFITNINAGEVYYIAYRKDGSQKAELVWKAIREFPVEIIVADMKLTYQAANLKARFKLSYADAFAAALTIEKKATLVTGDAEFNNLTGEENFKVRFL